MKRIIKMFKCKNSKRVDSKKFEDIKNDNTTKYYVPTYMI